MVKTCSKCNIEKPYTEFHKHKSSKDGYKSRCKSCRNELNKKYLEANKEKKKEYDKKYREANKDKIREYHKEYQKANKAKIIKYQKEYQKANKDKIKERDKEYREANKEKIKELQREWYEANKDKERERRKKYYEANKGKIIEKQKKYYEANKDKKYAYQKQRIKTDALFRLSRNLRTRTYQAFKYKGYSKNTKTQEMLGVDWEVAKAHIERQFTKGMNWDNYGEWHIDHIIPLVSAKTPERLKQLCHYTNLQPLWAEENLSKSNLINGQQTQLRI